MSKKKFIEKLLGDAHVQWTSLGDDVYFEIANNERKPVKAALRSAGKTPYYGANNIQDYVEGYTHEGAYVLIAEDGSASLEDYSIQYANGQFWANNHVHVVRGCSTLDTKFLYHYLRVVDFTPFLTGGGRAKLTKGKLMQVPIPIPCPDNPKQSQEIQSEIVRILDAFTELTAELTAKLTTELKVRKKQYNYYLDQLLTFGDSEVEWKALGDIGDFTYGYAAKAQEAGDARFVRITDINANGRLSPVDKMYVDISKKNEKYILNKNDLLMARTGASFGKTLIFEEEYAAIYAGFLIKLILDPKIVNPKYYWHFAQSKLFWDQAKKLVSGGGQPQFNANALKQVKLPIPHPEDSGKSLVEQARIASILDEFDALTNSLQEGLSREVELRQKQYEYYRDLLLSFPKPEDGGE